MVAGNANVRSTYGNQTKPGLSDTAKRTNEYQEIRRQQMEELQKKR